MAMRVVAIDVGAVRPPSRFAWAALDAPASDVVSFGSDPSGAVAAVVSVLATGGRCVLMVEAPMSVPVPEAAAWQQLGRARAGEGNRPWSAGAGAGTLATALAQCAWMMAELNRQLPGVAATTRPGLWATGTARLLLAEAFVSGQGKPPAAEHGQHVADAVAAGRELLSRLSAGGDIKSDVSCGPHRALNLWAATALHAGLAIAPAELAQDVTVIRTLVSDPVAASGAA